MSTAITYRIAAILLLLFALGHQFGFRSVDPAWHADSIVQAMQSTQFPVQGFARTYWQFFTGFGFFVTTFLLFAALFAWLIGGAADDVLRGLTPVLWAFALCFIVVTVLTWSYFFVAPGVFATLIAVCLTIGALQAQRAGPRTRETVQQYFDRLEKKDGWDSSLASQMVFTSYTSPGRHVKGKDAYLEATRRFYSTIADLKVRDVIIEGDRACVLTHYTLQPPNGAPVFESDVAEIFSVKKDKIDSFGIYFDSAPFPK